MYSFFVRTFKIYCLNQPQFCNTLLSTTGVVTTLYTRCSDLIHLTTESCTIFPISPYFPHPAPNNHFLPSVSISLTFFLRRHIQVIPHSICLSLPCLIHLMPLGSSVLLKVTGFPSFFKAEWFYIPYIHSFFSWSTIHWWTLRLFLCSSYYEQHFSEH